MPNSNHCDAYPFVPDTFGVRAPSERRKSMPISSGPTVAARTRRCAVCRSSKGGLHKTTSHAARGCISDRSLRVCCRGRYGAWRVALRRAAGVHGARRASRRSAVHDPERFASAASLSAHRKSRPGASNGHAGRSASQFPGASRGQSHGFTGEWLIDRPRDKKASDVIRWVGFFPPAPARAIFKTIARFRLVSSK